MGAQKYWSISRWDSGAGVWLQETQIPRAGLENFIRTKDSTITFVQLADGSEAKNSTETKSIWRDLNLIFPKQVVTSALKTQLLTYVDNEWGVKIIVPIATGASSYSQQILEGYITQYNEEWFPGSKTQEYQVRIVLHEFDVDADGSV